MIFGGETGGERGILSTKGLISLPLRIFCNLAEIKII